MIEFDKIATPFHEKASNCTNILSFVKIPKYFCILRCWVCPGRIGLLPDLFWRTSGSRLLRTLTAFFFEVSSSWDQSTFDDGVHFVSDPEVVDVLGKIIQ